MTCSGDKPFSFGRSNCLVHMTRTVSMSWVLLKGLQLVCLACTALPTEKLITMPAIPNTANQSPSGPQPYKYRQGEWVNVTYENKPHVGVIVDVNHTLKMIQVKCLVPYDRQWCKLGCDDDAVWYEECDVAFVHSQEECQLERAFDSSFLQASYREKTVLDAGCRTNHNEFLKEIHVLNYKSTHAGSSPANVLVNIDSQSETIQTKTLVLILNSNVSVEWEVQLHVQSPDELDVSLFKFVISRSSSLEFASQSKSYEVNDTRSPPVDDQELLSWVRNQYGNKIISYSAFHEVDEITMVINTDQSASSDCDLTSHSSPSAGYIVEDQNIWGCGPAEYDVINGRQIHVIELFSPTKYVEDNVPEEVEVQIQKGPNLEEGPRDTLLILVSLSPTLWKVESSRIDGKLTIISNNLVDSSLIRFTEVEMKVSKTILATRKGLLQWVEEHYGPVASFSNVRVANLFQVYLAGPTPMFLTSPSTFLESATELESSIVLTCHPQNIHVLVPIEEVLKYDLQPEAVTWRNKSCSGTLTDDGLELWSDSQSCGSTYSLEGADSEGPLPVSNQVTLYSSPVSEGSGISPSDDDDEDSVQILAQRNVTCMFDVISRDINNFPVQTPEPIPAPSDVSLYLDLYTDIEFAAKRTEKPFRLEIGDPVYFEMGVTREPRLNIVMGECWIGIPQAKLFEERLASITENGCPVEPSFQYLPVEFQPYRTKMPPGTVKRFTFNVPYLDDYAMTFYVFCNLSLCRNAPLPDYPQIVKCSSVPGENAPCSEWKRLKLWPMKNVEMGPFRLNSRELQHDNNLTGASRVNCQNGANGSLQVTSVIFAVVIFISFLIGVLLVSSIWLITKYTKVPSPSSPDNSPVGNGHIPNGHLPNGEARYEMQPFMQDGINPNNIPHEGLYDGYGGDPHV